MLLAGLGLLQGWSRGFSPAFAHDTIISKESMAAVAPLVSLPSRVAIAVFGMRDMQREIVAYI